VGTITEASLAFELSTVTSAKQVYWPLVGRDLLLAKTEFALGGAHRGQCIGTAGAGVPRPRDRNAREALAGVRYSLTRAWSPKRSQG